MLNGPLSQPDLQKKKALWLALPNISAASEQTLLTEEMVE